MKANFKSLGFSFSLLSILCFLFFSSSCSLFTPADENSSVLSFTISGSMAEKISSAASRGVDVPGTEANLFFEISLKGDFAQTKTAKVSEGAKLTFEEIPIGSSVWAEAVAYTEITENEEAQIRTNLYEGKSDAIVIHEGENAISLSMKKIENGTSDVEGTPYLEYSFSVDTKQLSSQLKGAADCVELASDGPVEWEDGKFYFASGEITIASRITIAANSTVYLILGDDATLNVNGITLDDTSKNLVIYGQSESSGILNAVSSSYSGIGGTGAGKGTITVHGGTVNAKAVSSAAGIGAAGNNGCFDGTVTLYNGTVNATGAGWGAGIGGTRNAWGQSGEVIVYGGSLTATGGTQGAGIGGGEGKPGGTLTVYGGYVKAIGGAGGSFTSDSPAGIGGGGSYSGNSEQNSNGGTVEIYSGTVEAYGVRAIGAGGSYGYTSQGTLTIGDGLSYEIVSGESESTASATTLEAYETDRNSYVKIVVQ